MNMSTLLLALLPLAIAAALQPLQVFAMISLMKGRRSVASGLAYISGMTAFRLALGALFWVLLSSVEEAIESGGGKFGIVVGIVLVVLGIALLFYGLRYGISANKEEEAKPTWLKKLGDASPAKAGLDWRRHAGAGSQGLAGGSGSRRHDCSGRSERLGQSAGLSMVRTAIDDAGLYSVDPGTGSAAKRHRETRFVERLAGQHTRTIVIAVAVLLGGYFLFTGLEMLGVFS